jgi:hypothetical protein
VIPKTQMVNHCFLETNSCKSLVGIFFNRANQFECVNCSNIHDLSKPSRTILTQMPNIQTMITRMKMNGHKVTMITVEGLKTTRTTVIPEEYIHTRHKTRESMRMKPMLEVTFLLVAVIASKCKLMTKVRLSLNDVKNCFPN